MKRTRCRIGRVIMFYVKAEAKKNTTKIGDLGEDIAAKFLKNKGFRILARNYLKKYGEIDIVAHETRPSLMDDVPHETVGKGSRNSFSRGTASVVHFVEVKSVSYETREKLEQAVLHETWRPEELVHAFKLNQIRKAAETWILENNWGGEVQVDVVAIRMVPRERYARVTFIPRVIAE